MIIRKVNEYQEELLEILQEECSEVIQASSKIKRFGLHASIDGNPPYNIDQLEMEIGDTLQIVDMLVEADIGLSYEGIAHAKNNKKERLQKWMRTSKPE